MKKNVLIILGFFLLVAFMFFIYPNFNKKFKILERIKGSNLSKNSVSNNDAFNSKRYFKDGFDGDTVVNESGKMGESESSDWWVNSGGAFLIKNGIASTIQGDLPPSSYWRIKYNRINSEETDNGLHPQNIFRLVTRSKWGDFEQSAFFKIIKDNLSSDSHRDASNGILLFNRYQDGDNLYYVGIRVDGALIIKKKIKGVYYTMAQKSFINGEKYNRNNNPDLLPKNIWLGIKSEVKNNSDGSVSIKLFIDKDGSGTWNLELETQDDGKNFGGESITNDGYAGIRTDFMDVEFSDYKIIEL